METIIWVLTILTTLVIILMYIIYQTNKNLLKFRKYLYPGQTVFFLDRYSNKYLPATIIKLERSGINNKLWRIEVHSEDGDYVIITNDLNIFNKKY